MTNTIDALRRDLADAVAEAAALRSQLVRERLGPVCTRLGLSAAAVWRYFCAPDPDEALELQAGGKPGEIIAFNRKTGTACDLGAELKRLADRPALAYLREANASRVDRPADGDAWEQPLEVVTRRGWAEDDARRLRLRGAVEADPADWSREPEDLIRAGFAAEDAARARR